MKTLFTSILALLLCISIVINIYSLRKNAIPLNVRPIPTGKEYTILLDGLFFFQISITHDSKLDFFKSYTSTKNYQVLNFHSNGVLSALLQRNQQDKLDGRSYYFYEKSGCLEADFPYQNGIISGNAVTYYDSSALLKETMLYTDLGEMYYKETWDRNGKLINKEGSLE